MLGGWVTVSLVASAYALGFVLLGSTGFMLYVVMVGL